MLTDWTLDPLQLVPVVLAAFAYATRARTLRRRGTPMPLWRVLLFSTGIGLLLLAFTSPIAAIGEQELFSFHMLQHVIIGDLAPLCLLAGLNGPTPRPLLAFRPVERLRVLANPFVALPLWAANLYVWHLPFLYEAAVEHSAVHALEHICFFSAGVIAWLPVLETLPAPEWFDTGPELAYIAIVRLVETLLGNVFVWSGAVFYGVYDRGDELWGISPLQDQGLAGAVMMIEGSLVTITALAWLFLRLAQEGELRQELLEQGLDPRAVRRAVRYGRARRSWPSAAELESSMRSSGVHHVDLVVSSIERSLPFYRELLGPLGSTRIGEVEGERGETIWYLGGAGCAVGLRRAQSEGATDRYRVGLHHVAFNASSRERGRRAPRVARRGGGDDRVGAARVRLRPGLLRGLLLRPGRDQARDRQPAAAGAGRRLRSAGIALGRRSRPPHRAS